MVKKLGGGKKPSLTAMIEELERAIDCYPSLERGGAIRKAEIDYRINILRWARATLQWLQEHEHDAKLFAEIKRLNPEAMQKLLNFVQAQQALIKAEAAEQASAA